MQQLAAMCIVSQESSRKCLNWPLVEFPTPTLPPIIKEILLCGNLVLAGGAVSSMLIGAAFSDYDFFYFGDIFEFEQKKKIFLRGEWTETANTISMRIDNFKIQLIKRIYSNRAHIIGGFDLDCARAYIDEDIRCYGTKTFAICLLFRISPVNIKCLSHTFAKRLYKYSRRGFKPIHIYCNSKNMFYYTAPCYDKTVDYHSAYISPDENLLYRNFSAMMKERPEKSCINKNYAKIEKSEFVKFAEFLYHSDVNSDTYNYKYYNKYRYYFPVFDVFRANARFYYINTKYNLNRVNERRLELIEKYYPQYEQITSVMISNPVSQFTASFQPVECTPQDFYGPYYTKVDLCKYCPEVIPILIYGRMLPKRIRWMIISHLPINVFL